MGGAIEIAAGLLKLASQQADDNQQRRGRRAGIAMMNTAIESAPVEDASPTTFESRVRQALENDKPDAMVLHELGVEAGRSGSAEQALELFSRAAAVDGENPLHYLSIARLLTAETMFNQAALAYLQAQELAPKDPAIMRELAGVLKCLDRNDEAQWALERLAELEREGPSER